MVEPTQPAGDALNAFLQERTGLCLNVLSNDASAQRVRDAMKRWGIADEQALLARLRSDKHVFDDFVAEITVPETYFFRDPAQFDFVREQVLPRFVGTELAIRVWSAGCATGEEAYSLAILLFEQGLARQARVLGTDISLRALARARRAEYGAWSLRGVPEAVVEAHFEAHAGRYHLNPQIAKMVSFHHHNLLSVHPPPDTGGPASFDLITCKNVFIYLTREKTQHIARSLAGRLAHSGWLVTGPSDPLLDISDLCETFATPFGLCYRRRAQRSSLRESFVTKAGLGLSSEARLLPPAWFGSTKRPPRVPVVKPAVESVFSPQEPAEQIRALANAQGSEPAERLCVSLLEQAPMSPGLHYLHAVLLLDLRREAEAEAAVRRALYLDTTLPVAHFLRGVLLARRGDVQASTRAFLCCQAYCESQAPLEPARFGDGITHAALAEAARDAVRRVAVQGATRGAS